MEKLDKLINDTLESYDKIKDKTKLNTSMIVIKCIIYDDTITAITIHQYLHKNTILYKHNIIINESNTKLGICTLKELNNIFKVRSLIKKNYCKILQKYINKDKDNNYYTISEKPITISDLEKKSQERWFGNPLFVKPKGLSFNVGNKIINKYTYCNKNNLYIPKTIKDILEDIKNDYVYYITNSYLIPKYVYSVKFDTSLRIKIISNCSELHTFEKKYKKHNPKTLSDTLDWMQIKKDWDGIIFYPWNDLQCIPFLNKHKKLTKKLMDSSQKIKKNREYYSYKNIFNNPIDILSETIIHNQKISDKISDFISVWQYMFDEDSGIIWNNFDKITLQQL